MNPNLPEGWKAISLGELLTKEQTQSVWEILNQPWDHAFKWKKVREYLCLHREMLEAKGVMPEYLAYVLEYLILDAEARHRALQNN